MSIPKQFRLTASQGSPWLSDFLLKYSAKLPASEALKVSPKLHKDILKVNQEIEERGLPSYLHLAYVHPKVKTGVFLRPDCPTIEVGSFIGIYTGLYELVESDITTGTSYAYDVAQGISLKKNQIQHVLNPRHQTDDYAIQTNAIEAGNFTRYINHTSLAPNIEAVVSKLPDGRMEILLFALHPIFPGEQLLSCYGGQYWKALGVIPNDMKPDTYLLNSSLEVKLSNPVKSLSSSAKKLLMPLRNVLTQTPLSLEKIKIFKDFKKKLPRVTKKQKKEIDAFEDFVLERGILRKWQISSQKGKLSITLKDDAKIIRKNEFIGLVAGTFSLKSSPCSFLIAEQDKASLYLDCSKESNFLSKLPCDLKKGNVTLKVFFDKEEDSPILLAFASKTIRPKDKLILNGLDPIILKK